MLKAFFITAAVVAASIAALFGIFFPLLTLLYKSRRTFSKYFYDILCSPLKLDKTHFIGFRPYEEYVERQTDETIKGRIRDWKHVLIVGPSLAGKSRAVYEVLHNLSHFYVVNLPCNNPIDRERFIFPRDIKWWRQGITFINDLHAFVEQQGFEFVLTEAMKRKQILVATCRSGFELDKAANAMRDKGLDIESVFSGGIVNIEKIEEPTAREIAQKSGISWAGVEFDGTVGSVFMPLGEMRDRFRNLAEREQSVLFALHRLYRCGMYYGHEVFPLDWVRHAVAGYGFEIVGDQWNTILGELQGKEFVTVYKNALQSEESYLEKICIPITDEDFLVLARRMAEVFRNEPYALLKLGNKLSELGNITREKALYNMAAIETFKKATKKLSPDSNPWDYAGLWLNIGNAYKCWAEVSDRRANCLKALEALYEALKIFTYQKYPEDYAKTNNSIGTAYGDLAQVEMPKENCKKAIEAFQEALRVHTYEDFPIYYAMAQNNLCNAYFLLAEVENPKVNYKKAIEACQEAFRVRTYEYFPVKYAMTQSNLGNVYAKLAEIEDRKENGEKAIKAYKEALQVYTYEEFPVQYAMTQSNLGNAYHVLAEVEKPVSSYRKAIEAYKEALSVYTYEDFSMDYAMTQSNLGSVYRILSEMENTKENCEKAVKAFKEALRVYTYEDTPIQYANMLINFGGVFYVLAHSKEGKGKSDHCKNAFAATLQALEIFKKHNIRDGQDGAKRSIGLLLSVCKEELRDFFEHEDKEDEFSESPELPHADDFIDEEAGD